MSKKCEMAFKDIGAIIDNLREKLPTEEALIASIKIITELIVICLFAMSNKKKLMN